MKSVRAVFQIIRNPWLLNRVLEDDKFWRKKVIRHFNMPDGLPVITLKEMFGEFSETVEPFAFLDGGSLPTDLALLKKLARGIPDCSYFEIGTWRGESVANVAPVAGSCFTLNLSDNEMRAAGLGEKYISLHRFFSKGMKNVIHLEGNSKTFEFQSLGKRYDLVFIDGDHHYEMVKNDTEMIFRHLVHERTIVVWHDYARNPETVRFEVLAGILDGSPREIHKNLFHVANTLCAVFLPGKTGGKILDAPVEPDGTFRVEISLKSKDSIRQRQLESPEM